MTESDYKKRCTYKDIIDFLNEDKIKKIRA